MFACYRWYFTLVVSLMPISQSLTAELSGTKSKHAEKTCIANLMVAKSFVVDDQLKNIKYQLIRLSFYNRAKTKKRYPKIVFTFRSAKQKVRKVLVYHPKDYLKNNLAKESKIVVASNASKSLLSPNVLVHLKFRVLKYAVTLDNPIEVKFRCKKVSLLNYQFKNEDNTLSH